MKNVMLHLLLSVLIGANTLADAQTKEQQGEPEGYMIIEGDIIVPKNFYDDPRNSTWRQNMFWPDGIVPFEFDANVTTANQTAMMAAMAEWERAANVDFRLRTNEADYVHIQDSPTSNSSQVGRVGGQQIINIFNWNFRFIMCHELAHTLGIWHEQSRPDRETFVRIETANITPGLENNFDRHGDAGQFGPYDFGSVMHYGQCAFSICTSSPCTSCPQPPPNPPQNLRTITVLPPNDVTWQNSIGQRSGLSHLDTLTMSFLYSFPNWRFIDRAFTGSSSGTFFNPYQSFTPSIAQNIPVGGVVWIQPGTYSSSGTYTRAMTLKAPLGGVVLAP